MRVLVTGGAGYIGSHTCIELLTSGHDVFVVDNLSNGQFNVINQIKHITKKTVGFCKLDIRDTKHLTRILKDFNPDSVIHFAGLKSVSESIQKPLEYYDVNVTGSISLLKSMSKIGCKNIVFSSSATVYGKPKYLPYDEMHPTKPINPYGNTKLFVEKILYDWSLENDQRRSIVLRYFNPVGAHVSGQIGESPNGTPNNLMPYLAQVAIGLRPNVNIFGNDYNTVDGTGVRDYIHVCDLANAHLGAVERLNSLNSFEVLNLGSGKGVSVLELIKTFEKVNGVEISKLFTARRKGDLPEFWASSSLAEKRIGFRAKYNLEQMCRHAWVWQTKNSNGINSKN